MRTPQTRIIEINVHRSKKNPRLGHAVALLFPCNHHQYLGLTLYKGEPDTLVYRAQDARIIKCFDYDVMDKAYCKLCPDTDHWLDDLASDIETEDLVEVLESLEDI